MRRINLHHLTVTATLIGTLVVGVACDTTNASAPNSTGSTAAATNTADDKLAPNACQLLKGSEIKSVLGIDTNADQAWAGWHMGVVPHNEFGTSYNRMCNLNQAGVTDPNKGIQVMVEQYDSPANANASYQEHYGSMDNNKDVFKQDASVGQGAVLMFFRGQGMGSIMVLKGSATLMITFKDVPVPNGDYTSALTALATTAAGRLPA